MNQKKCQFKAYDAEEKAVFSPTTVSSTGESRETTVLDDCIQALNFAFSKLVRADVIDEKDVESESVLSTFSFCISLFLELYSWACPGCLCGKLCWVGGWVLCPVGDLLSTVA